MRTPLALALALLLAAAACSSSTEFSSNGDGDSRPDTSGLADDDPVVQLDDIDLVAALVPFDACESFLTHVQGEAAERVGPYGLDGSGGYFPVPLEGDVVFEEEASLEADDAAGDTAAQAPAPAAEGEGGPVGGRDFSETNVQEVGVDEPDIVKTDGNRIVTVTNNRVTVVDVSGDEPVEVGSVTVEGGWPREMFLAGDRLLVIGDGDGGTFGPVAVDAEEQFAEETTIAPDIAYFGPTTVVWDINIGDGVTLGDRLEMEGWYLSGRAVDGTARIVISASPNELPFVYPQNPAGEDRAAEANREIVFESTVEDWVPSYAVRAIDGTITEEGLLLECNRINRPEAFAGFDMLTVVGLDLSEGVSPVDTTGVLASGETVYASTEALYVATTRWPDAIPVDGALPRDFEEKYTTSLHKFSTNDDGSADYEASGSVRGHLLNQFSLDEHDGYLRVATTDGSPWGGTESSESFVTVLEEQGETLVGVGQVGGLGRGEQIFAVRFIDDTAYVVTFRQVDPFYVVDLREPTAPAVVGELKIPGFSSYLHPIGDDLVLGVGQDATEDGFTTGAKVSLFDVADPANPTELAVWTAPNGQSDVEWDHRAFLWWEPSNMAVLPVNVWSDNFFGAVVLDVDRERGITEIGRFDQTDTGDTTGSTGCLEVESTATNFEEADSELDYIVLEGGTAVVCEPGTSDPVNGYFCDGPYPVAEVDAIFGPTDVELPGDPGDELWLCWPEGSGGDPIMRTLVVGEDLWSMSWQWLQANDLDTLERGPRFPIG